MSDSLPRAPYDAHEAVERPASGCLAASTLSRRDLGRVTLQGLLTWTLLDTLSAGRAFAVDPPASVAQWMKRLDELGHDVVEQRISQVEWQGLVEDLFRQVSLPDLLKFVDFEGLTRNLKHVDNGARSLSPKLPRVAGLPEQLVFGRQIFAMKQGRSVVPHGHNNMATAFLVLQGELHGRHYDRLEDQAEHLLIRPTIDRSFKAGETSSVSDYRDNIHWFKAVSDTAFIFNIHVLNCRPGAASPTGRIYVDPNGEKLQGNLIRAPKLGYREAHEIYG